MIMRSMVRHGSSTTHGETPRNRGDSQPAYNLFEFLAVIMSNDTTRTILSVSRSDPPNNCNVTLGAT